MVERKGYVSKTEPKNTYFQQAVSMGGCRKKILGGAKMC
jgi:hypothetical protein